MFRQCLIMTPHKVVLHWDIKHFIRQAMSTLTLCWNLMWKPRTLSPGLRQFRPQGVSYMGAVLVDTVFYNMNGLMECVTD